MKKQYMIPEIQVVKIQPYVLSVTSPGGPDTGGRTNDPNDLLGRRYRDFDDEEDDEEF